MKSNVAGHEIEGIRECRENMSQTKAINNNHVIISAISVNYSNIYISASSAYMLARAASRHAWYHPASEALTQYLALSTKEIAMKRRYCRRYGPINILVREGDDELLMLAIVLMLMRSRRPARH